GCSGLGARLRKQPRKAVVAIAPNLSALGDGNQVVKQIVAVGSQKSGPRTIQSTANGWGAAASQKRVRSDFANIRQTAQRVGLQDAADLIAAVALFGDLRGAIRVVVLDVA